MTDVTIRVHGGMDTLNNVSYISSAEKDYTEGVYVEYDDGSSEFIPHGHISYVNEGPTEGVPDDVELTA